MSVCVFAISIFSVLFCLSVHISACLSLRVFVRLSVMVYIRFACTTAYTRSVFSCRFQRSVMYIFDAVSEADSDAVSLVSRHDSLSSCSLSVL